MFNLLPTDFKKALAKEYFTRLIAVSLFFLTAIAVIMATALFPSFVNLTLKHGEILDQLEKLEQQAPELKDAERLSAIVGVTNDKLKVLKPSSDLTPSAAVQKISSALTSGIELRSLTYQKRAEEVGLSISGFALSREALLAFSGNLESVEEFKEVNLPVTNLARERDIVFSLTLTIIR